MLTVSLLAPTSPPSIRSPHPESSVPPYCRFVTAGALTFPGEEYGT